MLYLPDNQLFLSIRIFMHPGYSLLLPMNLNILARLYQVWKVNPLFRLKESISFPANPENAYFSLWCE